jgi:NADPH:quinone reductase-like Zn-dependent oxidoreductase
MLSPFVGQRLRTFITSENAKDLLVLTGLIESGTVTPVIDRTYSLAKVPEAIQYITEGRARGKIVTTV